MSWLDATPFSVVASFVAASLLGAIEVGRRLGDVEPPDERQISTISGHILALVGLLLAFSFSMAGDRYSQRWASAVKESNSIGTFWLRTSLLPEPTRSQMQSRIRRYVALHIEDRLARVDEQRLTQIEAEADRLQQELWTLAIDDVRRNPEAARQRLVIPALNDMLSDMTYVLAAKENRLPTGVLIYLFLLVVLAGLMVGYRTPGQKRSVILWLTYTIAIGSVLVMLVDMNRPRRGLLQTSLNPYLRLRDSIRQAPP
jgi:hypothetical protein